MRGKGIVVSGHGVRRLVWRRLGRRNAMTVHMRRRRLLMRLLAQRVDLEPCAGRKHQQFKRAGIEQTRRASSAVDIDQRGNFVFQNQGKNPAFSARWRSNFLQETRVQVGSRRARRHAITDRASDSRSAFVESEIFHRIAIVEASSLPSGGMAALYDKERDSRRIASAGIEQRAQNLPL